MPSVPTFVVVTPPVAIVAPADARAYTNIPASVPDAALQAFIDAAVGFLDGPDGWLNRSLGAQTIACTLARGWCLGLRRPAPTVLAAGPVTDIVSIIGLGGTDTFGSSTFEVDGDVVQLYQPLGPTWGSPPPGPVLITYKAGSPAGVIAQVKSVVMAMVAKQVAAAATSVRDPSLRSELIPDTFSKSWDVSGQSGPFGAATLAPIAHLRRWS